MAKSSSDYIIDFSLEQALLVQLKEFRTSAEWIQNHPGCDTGLHLSGQRATRDYAKALVRVMVERGLSDRALKIVRRQVARMVAYSKQEN